MKEGQWGVIVVGNKETKKSSQKGNATRWWNKRDGYTGSMQG